jgi:cytochrome c biogenesis protein CcmG/thiol:disulfide interchange protein DsbE
MSGTDEQAARTRGKIWFFIPLIVFLLLGGVFALQLVSGRNEAIIPSALIGKPAPETKLPPLEGAGLPGIDSASFPGKVTVVNVWASWCAPCREENAALMEMTKDNRFLLAGLNYKDKPDNALHFLQQLGNPYDMIGVDHPGTKGIDWGVYGVPETFVVGPEGTILHKHVGPLTPELINSDLMPVIEKALASKKSG